MQVLTESYDLLELQQLRSELERRGIKVLIADEFTYAIPGMPGAERPRRVLVAEEDMLPAKQVVADLLGEDRIHKEDSESTGSADRPQINTRTATYLWIGAGLAILMLIVVSAR
jgi:hypothetical protein